MHSEDARQSLKERQRQEREVLIIQAAEKMLLEKGYHEMSMDEIAAQVGIAKSTVYLHFPGKEDLVVAIIERKMAEFLKLVVETAEMELSAREKLELIFERVYLQRVTYKEKIFSGLPLLIQLLNDKDVNSIVAKVGERVGRFVQPIRTRLLALLQEGQQNGEFDDRLPVDVMLGCFFSMVSPLTYGRLGTEQQPSLDRLVKYTKCMYFRSIAAGAQPDCA